MFDSKKNIGNKRTGFVAMYSFLIHHKLTITADSNNMYQFIISISTGSINFKQIVEWLKKNTTKNHIKKGCNCSPF